MDPVTRTPKRYYKVLASFLVLLLLFPFPSYAKNDSKIAVLELHHPKGSPGSTLELADRIRKSLSARRPKQILSRAETISGIQSLNREGGLIEEDLGTILINAQKQYEELELDRAERMLQKRLTAIEKEGVAKREIPHLPYAYLLLGVIQLAKGQKTLAEASFQRVVSLVPDLRLSERDYAPSVRRLFEKARSHHEATLKKDAPPLESPEQKSGVAGFSVSQIEGRQEILRKGVLVGQWLSVDTVVLVHTEEGANGIKETVKLLDLSSSDSLAERSTGDLIAFTHETLFGKGRRSRETAGTSKPLWKRPLFWVIGGAILAGTGVGIGLAISSSSGGDGSGVDLQIPPL